MIKLLEIIAIGAGLSMDALAVSIALGTTEKKLFSWGKMLITALFFGLFQAFMPAIGWFGGSLCAAAVQAYGRYIAFGLLALIGGKMIFDSVRGAEKEEQEKKNSHFGLVMLTGLAFATSIDALLVGVGFACLGRSDILLDVILIGCTTFLISLGGCAAGRKFGDIFGSKCEIAGGIVLILIGLKILLFG